MAATASWPTSPGWIEVIDIVTGQPAYLNVTWISVIAPAATAGHTTIYVAQGGGKESIEVAEPYTSLRPRLRAVIEAPRQVMGA